MSQKSWVLVLVLSAAVLTIPACGDKKDKGGASSTPKIVAKPGKTSNGGGGTGGNGNTGKPSVAEGFGSFSGKVVFVGTPPVMKQLDSTKDPICAANAAKIVDQTLIVDTDSKGVANVFIYLTEIPDGAKETKIPEDPVKFDQKFCTFKSRAMTIRVNRPMSILSSDNTLHNTNIKPLNGSIFNQGIKPGDQSGDVKYSFEAPEEVPTQVLCDIHKWMKAYILPLEHDFVAVTNAKGEFKIDNLPSGDHEFVVWHEKVGFLNQSLKVTITANGDTEKVIDFK